MPSYIEQRRQGWYAVLNVPVDVQARLRRKRFRVTLKTRDPRDAERRAMPLVAEWQRQIELARGGEAAKDDPAIWREALKRAITPEDRINVETALETHVLMQGLDNSDPEAKRFYNVAFGRLVSTTEHLDEWLKAAPVKDKTAGMRRATIERLAKKFPYLQDATRKEVRHWVTELQAELKTATIQRMLSDCRTYWAYLATIEAAPEGSTPYDKLGLRVKSQSWLPYSPEEALRLLEAAENEDKELADLTRLAMYSGARREELCSLRVEHVKADRFEIVDAKTDAGIRTVPIHRKLSATIKRLVKGSKDGYVLSGLKANANGDRGDAIGKRFTRLKQELGFDDRHTFHSWRSTVITLLERAGVPESTVQDIVGHERSTLTGSTYSGKSTFEMRRAALAKLRY